MTTGIHITFSLPSNALPNAAFISVGISILGLVYLFYPATKRSWFLIEDPQGRQLARADTRFRSRWLAQILRPEGGVIARMTPEDGRPRYIYTGDSYLVEISSQDDLDPLLILSYGVLVAATQRVLREIPVPDID